MSKPVKQISRVVREIWTRLGIRGGESDAATISRALVSQNNHVVIDGEKLSNEDATHAASVRALLGVDSTLIATLLASADLSSLPTSNPGNGKPWLDSGAVRVGVAPE